MSIIVNSISTHKKEDVRYYFTDGTKLIHDSKRYYIGKKAPENEVDIDSLNFGTGDAVVYKFKNRGSEPSEPDKYKWRVTSGKTTTRHTGASLPGRGVADLGSTEIRTEWSNWEVDHDVWSNKGSFGTSHTKDAIRDENFERREKRAGRIK